MSVVNKTNNLIRKKYKLRPRRNLFNLGNLYHRSNPYYDLRVVNNISYTSNVHKNDIYKTYRETTNICEDFERSILKKRTKDEMDLFLDDEYSNKRIRAVSLDSINGIDMNENDFEEIIPYRPINDNEILINSWEEFNNYQPAPGISKSNEIREKDWVSPSNIKNYML